MERTELQENSDTPTEVTPQKKSKIDVKKILYSVAAVFVIIGLREYLGEIWSLVGPFGRIALTLLLGIALTVSAMILVKQRKIHVGGSVLHFIGGLLVAAGISLVLFELHSREFLIDNLFWLSAFLFFIMTGVYAFLAHKERGVGHSVFVFMAVSAFTTTAIFALRAISDTIIFKLKIIFDIDVFLSDLYTYLSIAIGVLYIALAYMQKETLHRYLSRFLYIFGYLGIYASFFEQAVLHKSIPWEVAGYFIIVLGFYLSRYMNSRILLVMGILFLVPQIFYTASEHFSLTNWPIMLIILGVLVAIFGYLSTRLSLFSKQN